MAAFGVALILTVITSIVAAIVQSILGLFCAGFIFLLLLGGVAFYLKRARPKAALAV
jgi:hypothetical protein